MKKGVKILILSLAIVGGIIFTITFTIAVIFLVSLLYILGFLMDYKKSNNNTNSNITITTNTTTNANNNKPNNSNNSRPVVEVEEFKEFNYSPGYSDMDGQSIYETLHQNEDGEWVIERRYRQDFESPTMVSIYSVTDEEAKAFADFIIDNNICELKDRPDSDLFITDYSSWGYGIEFDNSSIGGDAWEYYGIGEYKEYSDEDYALLDELDKRFENLHYNLISETEEEDDY